MLLILYWSTMVTGIGHYQRNIIYSYGIKKGDIRSLGTLHEHVTVDILPWNRKEFGKIRQATDSPGFLRTVVPIDNGDQNRPLQTEYCSYGIEKQRYQEPEYHRWTRYRFLWYKSKGISKKNTASVELWHITSTIADIENLYQLLQLQYWT